MKQTNNPSPHSRDLLVHGIASAKVGEKEQAYRYLERYLYQEPPEKEKLDAMYYLSLVSPTEDEQRNWLEKILAIDPVEGRARRQLAILNGDLDVKKIVDPDRISLPANQLVPADDLERFTCPQCGGRMSFSPDGLSLICEHCEAESFREKSKNQIEEGNFLIAMATEKGHSKAVNAQISHCSGCGAEFIIPPLQLSWQCPYCESNYAVVQKEVREILSPEALIPFQFSKEQAYQQLLTWWQTQHDATSGKFESLQGIYQPVWTFDVGGFVDWQLEEKEDREWFLQSSTKAIYYDDICIPATRKSPDLMPRLIDSYDFKALLPFDAQYLANWMAESYEIPAGNAAINARKFALDAEYQYLRDVNVNQIRNLHINSGRMTVEQFKLILVPVWRVILILSSDHFPVLMNGQNGKIFSAYQSHSKNNWFTNLLNWRD